MGNIYYEWYKQHHICTSCFKNSAARGKTKCPNCLFEDAEKSKKKRAALSDEEREDYYNKLRKRKKDLYERRKAEGQCVQCGQRPPLGESVRCGICKDKARRQAEKHRIKIGQRSHDERCEHDVCYNCYGVSVPGKRLCANCIDNAMKNLGSANKKINWYNHPWR